jgi:hypothetical protein
MQQVPKPSNAPDELELKMTRELKELKAELDALERTLAVSLLQCCLSLQHECSPGNLKTCKLTTFTDFEAHKC